MKNFVLTVLSASCLASCAPLNTPSIIAKQAVFHSRFAVVGSAANDVQQAVSDGTNMQVLFRSLVAAEPKFTDSEGRPIAWSGAGNIAHFPNQKGDITVTTVAGQLTIAQSSTVAKSPVEATAALTPSPVVAPITEPSPTLAVAPAPVKPFDLSVAQFKEFEQAELPKLKMADSLESLKYAIYFEYATDKLNPTGQAAIELLQRDAVAAKSITVTGRADPSGIAAQNVKLARARSNSVKAEFVKWGVAGSVIKVDSAVGIAHIDGQIALKQNVPLKAAAASRRADVTMQVAGKNQTSKVAQDSRFVTVDGS